MKIFAVILSLYAFLLAVAPVLEGITSLKEAICCRHSCGEEREGSADSTKDDCTELCNPFLSCQCCAGFDLLGGNGFSYVFPPSFNRSEDFVDLNTNQVVSSVWHPPKVKRC